MTSLSSLRAAHRLFRSDSRMDSVLALGIVLVAAWPFIKEYRKSQRA